MHRRARTALRSLEEPFRICRACRRQLGAPVTRRYAQLQATPSVSPDDTESSAYSGIDSAPAPSPDAQFEVLGHPYSLLSVKLSPSQNLYTRRGSLVALQGKPEDVVSTLSVLGPLRRSLLGIPFLYQRISSTSPVTALVSTKSAISSFSVVHLDGRLDWIVAQRGGLLAWTGHSLSVTPKAATKLGLAHWGSSHVTGRGLLALVGKGQIYSVHLRADESYVAHPGAVLAYTVNAHAPAPYRFKSSRNSGWRMQVPGVGAGWLALPDTRFFRVVRDSQAWRAAAALAFALRTWARRTVWGDRLFLQFRGPMTILLQSRAAGLTDVLTSSDVNEIADAPAGAVRDAAAMGLGRRDDASGSTTATMTTTTTTSGSRQGGAAAAPPTTPAPEQPTKMSVAVVRGGKVEFS